MVFYLWLMFIAAGGIGWIAYLLHAGVSVPLVTGLVIGSVASALFSDLYITFFMVPKFRHLERENFRLHRLIANQKETLNKTFGAFYNR